MENALRGVIYMLRRDEEGSIDRLLIMYKSCKPKSTLRRAHVMLSTWKKRVRTLIWNESVATSSHKREYLL